MGFKWLAKSIIANLEELGPRVNEDVEAARLAEAQRKEKMRIKYEEKR